MDKERAQAWSMEEVVDRWLQLYNGSPLADRWRNNPDSISQAELDKVMEVVALWRERLYDISWITKCYPAFRPSGQLQGLFKRLPAFLFARHQ